MREKGKGTRERARVFVLWYQGLLLYSEETNVVHRKREVYKDKKENPVFG